MLAKPVILRGFTLIELLVVIAIIGVLASVVFAFVKSARDKANDASVRRTLSDIRSVAGLYYDNNNSSYGIFDATPQGVNVDGSTWYTCRDSANLDINQNLFKDSQVKTLIAKVREFVRGQGSSADTFSRCVLGNASGNGQSWAISFTSNVDQTHAWCVDSTGASRDVNQTFITSVICP